MTNKTNMQPYRLLIFFLLYFPLCATCQSFKKWEGKIVDATNGHPISNARIHAKAAANYTHSDSNGYFSILLSAPDTLFISHKDRKTITRPIENGTPIPLILEMKREEAYILDSVLVVSNGYQEISKERSTGSYTIIDNAQLNMQKGPFIIDRLKGTTPGIMLPGKTDAPEIAIWGLASINGGKSPLIVLDNFPYEGDLKTINPNDVASVTILKDATASSIWGTRAGNGVIVISTKSGRNSGKMKLSFTANTSVVEKPDLFYLPQISPSDYASVEEMLFSNDYYSSLTNSTYPFALSPIVELLLKKQKGEISENEYLTLSEKIKRHDIRSDYEKYFYQKGVQQQYHLSATGGNATSGYYLSVGIDQNKDNLDASYQRISFSLNNNFNPLPSMLLKVGITYTNTKTRSGKVNFEDLHVGLRQIPYLSLVDENGSSLPIAKDYSDTYTDTTGDGRLLDWKYYPLEEGQHTVLRSGTNHLRGTMSLNQKLLRGLAFVASFQYENQQNNSHQLYDKQSYYARNLINQYSVIDPNGLVSYQLPMGSILTTSHGNIENVNLRGQLNYNVVWGKHAMTAIAGGETRQVKTSQSTDRYYGYNEDYLTSTVVDYNRNYISYVDGFSLSPDNGVNKTGLTNRYISYYSNIAYQWDDKYLFNISGRKDASNLFGVKSNDKWNPLWSVGMGWKLSDESFFHIPFLSKALLRATYGVSGAVDPSRSAVTTLQMIGASNYTNYTYARVSQYGNPNLKWETVRTLNFGLEFTAFLSRVNANIQYYKKMSRNLFGPYLVDYTAGLNAKSITSNVAAMDNTGWDIDINSRNIIGRFSWQTHLVLGISNNKVKSFYRSSNTAVSLLSDGNNQMAFVGKPLYSLVSYRWGGLDNSGNPQGYVGNEKSKDYEGIYNSTDSKSIVYSGPALPTVFGNIENTFTFRNMSFTLNILYKFGYYFRKPSTNYYNLFEFGQGNSDFSARWKVPGDEGRTNVPSLIYPENYLRDAFYTSSEATVEKGDHIKLQFIRFDYIVPSAGLKKLKITQVGFYCMANNLGLLWKSSKSGLDPDFPSTIPTPKNYLVGCNITF